MISQMDKGRDAAAVVATVLLLNNENASAATFTVGDASGWKLKDLPCW